ncbi:MAG: tetratricopeptide repeat protein [Aestuariivirga sp.]
MADADLRTALRTGWAYLEAGNAAAAGRAAEDALAIDPGNGEALELLSRSFIERRNWRHAEDVARHLIAAAPEDPDGYALVALALSGRGQGHSALGFFDQALACDETHALSHHGRALILESLGRPKDAKASYQRVMELDPDNPNILAHFSSFLMGNGQTAEATELLTRAGEVDAGSFAFMIAKGHEALRNGDAATAREQALLALEQNSVSSEAIELMILSRMQTSRAGALWWRLLRMMNRLELKHQLWLGGAGFLLWSVLWMSWSRWQPKPLQFFVLLATIFIPVLLQAGPFLLRHIIARELKTLSLRKF